MKDKINAFKDRYVRTKTDAERDAIREDIIKLCDKDTVVQTTKQPRKIRDWIASLRSQ